MNCVTSKSVGTGDANEQYEMADSTDQELFLGYGGLGRVYTQ